MLTIELEKVCYIIVKAREFDAKVDPEEPESSSSAADDDEREVLEFRGDATEEELKAAIDALNVDEGADLLALVWVGRGDYTGQEWAAARREARERNTQNLSGYLMGIPMLGDFLEEGLSQLGLSCEEYEIDRI